MNCRIKLDSHLLEPRHRVTGFICFKEHVKKNPVKTQLFLISSICSALDVPAINTTVIEGKL